MFGKIKEMMEAKAKAEEMRKKLDLIEVEGTSYGNEVLVKATGGRKIVSIDINQGVLNVREKHEIEHLVKQAVNQALEKADALMAEEMKAILPNIPGLGM